MYSHAYRQNIVFSHLRYSYTCLGYNYTKVYSALIFDFL